MQIQIKVKHNENFTATSLMWQFAKANHLECINEQFKTYIKIKGEYWQYDHWHIEQCAVNPENDMVTLFLIKKES